MSVRWVGVIEADPQPGPGGTTTLPLAAEAQLFEVSVSGWHARWVGSIDPGTLVEVVGELAAPGLVHARWVWPVAEDLAD
jgi:hypothetical protein